MLQANLLHSKPRIQGVGELKQLVFLFGKIVGGVAVAALLLFVLVPRVSEWFAPQEYEEPPAIGETVVQETEDAPWEDRLSVVHEEAYHLAYKDMPLVQQFQYEHGYTKAVFDFIVRHAPPGGQFTSLTVDDFSTVSGTVTFASRDEVRSFFLPFEESSAWTIRPRPETSIRSYDDFYEVTYVFDYVLPAQRFLEDDPVEERFVSSDHIQRIRRKVIRLADNNDLRITNERSLGSTRRGGYREYERHIDGEGRFSDFVYFLHALYTQSPGVRFRTVELSTRSGEISFSGVVCITVLE
ncbi:hypothetical protein [Chitinivibrio alkaliphilus]|uniref:Uncharacterized protein n=1 Tax=Chitinivibrio alkaliphilus ACht1 TaxID=1313304 RepID=U7D7Q3_9BACT|nr:hypothetical protein [Chitinivibrio alkaliphilus]ERP31606.1 hypothetical protein CALK_1469 [Chitinivibrio alkaliphilus ACht1]